MRHLTAMNSNEKRKFIAFTNSSFIYFALSSHTICDENYTFI